MRPDTAKKTAALVAGAAISVAGAGLLAEISIRGLRLVRDTSPLRLYENPGFGYAYRPDQEARSLYGVTFRTNDLGLRNETVPLGRTPGKRRVVVLGDSVTMGYGVPQDQTFASRLEDQLRSEGVEAEVVNAGVEGYNIHNQSAFYESVAGRYDPTDVVLVALANDFQPAAARIPYISPAGIPTSSRDAVLPLWLRYRLRGLATAVFAQDLIKRRSATKTSREQPDAGAWTTEFHRLADHLEDDWVRFHVALFPRMAELEEPTARAEATRAVAQAASSAGVPFIDLSPALLAETSNPGELFLPSDPVHPNPRGHEIVARTLARRLANEPRHAR